MLKLMGKQLARRTLQNIAAKPPRTHPMTCRRVATPSPDLRFQTEDVPVATKYMPVPLH
jgi:hypothetical protein